MENFNIDPSVAYDVVQLPSQGLSYTNKKKSVRVGYLTAADENVLMSPNLINGEAVVDELLRRKILDRDLNIDELVEEDRQAILIFLRNTAFGSIYKVNAVDPKTGEKFEQDIDLSSLKTKEFTLKGNENDEYSYYLTISKKEITFKFLTQSQENELLKIKNSATGKEVSNLITKRLEMMIKSVDGNKDPMTIYQFIQTMPIKDSQDFKKFVSDNKPGLDLFIDIAAPSGEKVTVIIDFGVEFFRPFYGL
jgi:hypothetical protein